ncbi:MAG: hypothetical protein RJA98_3916, partial [Pseudomonadota bacterium]
ANPRGASCLGPHSGLQMQAERFAAALAALRDPAQTVVVLVTRADASAIREASRTSDELKALGLRQQRLVVNAVFHASVQGDAVASAIEALGQQALADMPANLRALPQQQVPLRRVDNVGLAALRALLSSEAPEATDAASDASPLTSFLTASLNGAADTVPGLAALADALAAPAHGLIMVMGKGGVGKTTIAAALALGLVQRGHSVHLSTTDPAAHLAATLNGAVPGLTVDRIDPAVETQAYIDKVMAAKGAGRSEAERALMLEDLRSPCTEEVAVFHAFSRVVSEARSAFVVLDTAPTGHSLLLMDSTGAYHRQMQREFAGRGPATRMVTPMMRLQDPAYTRIVLVTLPEATPVSQAAALQADLRRAQIEPFAWVINKSVLAAGTRDPLLQSRLRIEQVQRERMVNDEGTGLALRLYAVPWCVAAPVGVAALSGLVSVG